MVICYAIYPQFLTQILNEYIYTQSIKSITLNSQHLLCTTIEITPYCSSTRHCSETSLIYSHQPDTDNSSAGMSSLILITMSKFMHIQFSTLNPQLHLVCVLLSCKNILMLCSKITFNRPLSLKTKTRFLSSNRIIRGILNSFNVFPRF